MLATGSARIRRSITLYAVAAMVAVSVAVTAVVAVPMQRHMAAAAERGLAHSLDLQVLAIGEAVSRLRDLAFQVTSRSVIRDALADYNSGKLTLDALRRFTGDKLADALRLAPEMIGIIRLDRDGVPVVAVGEPVPMNAQHPSDGDAPEIGALYLTADGRPRLTIAAPIIGTAGAREGTDVVLFDASALAALTRDGARPGRTWESALLADGADGPVAVLPAGRPFVLPAPGQELAASADGAGSVSVVMARPVAGTPWQVAVRMDAADLYYDVDRLLWRVGGAALGLTALGTLGMALVVRPLAGRMLVRTDALARQVEEQERTVASLQRAQRTLRTLSGGNQALIHAEKEQDLLDEMCRIMVEVGGYPRAWVVLSGCEGAVLAAHGRRDGDDHWPDIAGLGELIASGTPLHLPDASADSRFAGLVAAGERRAILLLPLVAQQGQPLGAVGIQARDASGFDRQERALLTEMVGDLAFGIRGLRDRAAWRGDQERLERALERTIQAIAATTEARDPFTAGHQRRVGELAAAIAREMGLAEDRVKGIYVAGVIHDIGKIAVPAEVLSRPGRLNDLEFELVKAHPESGAAIIAGVEFPWPVAEAIAQHHERLDGSGYPQGLRGNGIVLESRILAVADVVDAMSTHRPYRPAMELGEALAEIRRGRGTLYDAAVVDACIALAQRGAMPAGDAVTV